MNNRQTRWFIGVAAVMLMVGVLLGAAVGGLTAYFVMTQWAAPETVAVAQPAEPSDFVLPPAEPQAQTTPTEEPTPPATETPAPMPTVPAPAPGTGSAEDPIVAAVQRVQPATVFVLTDAGSSGSGFIISEDGYIVTNDHVIQGAGQFAVTYDNGERVPATLVGASPEFDLAVLKVEGPVPAVATWGDSSAVPVGSQVIAIGSALGDFQNSVTLGILSGVNRQLEEIPGMLQTDAAINHGNSGGPLLNRHGEVIGINTMVIRGGYSNAEGLGFAIPSSLAKSVTQQLIETGAVQWPVIGVFAGALNPQLAEEYGVSISEGAYVTEVIPGSPSEQAGLQVGDVIVAVNGKPVNDREPLVIHILSHKVGDQITVTVLRGSEQLDLQLTLAPRQA
jgi:2-alkenal reductase